MTHFSCGIDFGTSNSTCAVSHSGGVSLVPVEGTALGLPSALFFSEEGDVFFGREAISAYIEGEEGRLLRGLKSVLGTRLMQERTVVAGASKTFKDILGMYIRNLKQKAEAFCGAPLTDVVLGRPVHFHDNAPEADRLSEEILRDIARDVGFREIVFQYEPIAAAYAHEQGVDQESLALVVDLGGGTSDFTVIRLSPDRLQQTDRQQDILATTGIRVGGTNFDKAFSLDHFMPFLGLGSSYTSEFDRQHVLTVPSKPYHDLSDWPLVHQGQNAKAIAETKKLLRTSLMPDQLHNLLLLQEEQAGHAFLQEIEQVKIALSACDQTEKSFLPIGLNFSVQASRPLFLASIQGLLERIDQALFACLHEAACRPEDIDLVILTGGSSELPAINHRIVQQFPQAQISKEDKFGSVGRGLAHQAQWLATAIK